MSLSPLSVHIDKPAFVRKQHSSLAAQDNKNKIKNKKKAPNHPDEIKRIYSLYKGKTDHDLFSYTPSGSSTLIGLYS